MKKETISIILTLIILIPMTFFLFLSIYGVYKVLSNFSFSDTMILASMIFGILGYIGLMMNLKQNKKIKSEFINFVLLLLGLIGFIMFNSFTGGIKAWKWIVFIEEPDEWIIFVGPILITILLITMKGENLITLYKGNTGESNKPEHINHL